MPTDQNDKNITKQRKLTNKQKQKQTHKYTEQAERLSERRGGEMAKMHEGGGRHRLPVMDRTGPGRQDTAQGTRRLQYRPVVTEAAALVSAAQ